MKKVFVLLNLSLIFLLSSCGGQKETTQVVVQAPTTKAEGGGSGGGTTGSAGGGDLGGGNTLEGKLIEDYRVMISEDSAYREYIKPIVLLLKDQFPELAADFLHITEARRWYIVPADLNSLDSLKIGIPFEMKTQQVALHTPEVIYIDKRIWDTLELYQKGLLITHEIVMGVKWIENHEGLDRCLAESRRIFVKNNFTVTDDYNEAKRKCHKEYVRHFINPTKFKLKGQDYDNIRTLTSDLFKFKEKINWEDLKNWFKSVSFREY